MRVDSKFCFKWIGASALGFACSLFVLGATSAFVQPPAEVAPHKAYYVLVLTLWFAVGGAVVGLPQYFVLKPALGQVRWWICASAVGWGLGFLALFGIWSLYGAAATTHYSMSITVGAAAGALVGTSQWVVIGQHVRRNACLWVPANVTGYCVFMMSWTALDESAFGGLVGCIAGNALTGIALAWLLRPHMRRRSLMGMQG